MDLYGVIGDSKYVGLRLGLCDCHDKRYTILGKQGLDVIDWLYSLAQNVKVPQGKPTWMWKIFGKQSTNSGCSTSLVYPKLSNVQSLWEQRPSGET